jgi:hypothetical protein
MKKTKISRRWNSGKRRRKIPGLQGLSVTAVELASDPAAVDDEGENSE